MISGEEGAPFVVVEVLCLKVSRGGDTRDTNEPIHVGLSIRGLLPKLTRNAREVPRVPRESGIELREQFEDGAAIELEQSLTSVFDEVSRSQQGESCSEVAMEVKGRGTYYPLNVTQLIFFFQPEVLQRMSERPGQNDVMNLNSIFKR